MNNSLYIDLPRKAFAPGENVDGELLWTLDRPPEEITLTLGWWTEGRGTRDARVEVTRTWKTMETAGKETFSLTLPPSPYSFAGTLIALKWALEARVRKGKATVVEPLTVAPAGDEIRLTRVPE